MKLEIIAQANGQEMNLTNLDKEVKEQIKAAGLKLTKVDNATAYVNINEGKTYVVVETEGVNATPFCLNTATLDCQ